VWAVARVAAGPVALQDASPIRSAAIEVDVDVSRIAKSDVVTADAWVSASIESADEHGDEPGDDSGFVESSTLESESGRALHSDTPGSDLAAQVVGLAGAAATDRDRDDSLDGQRRHETERIPPSVSRQAIAPASGAARPAIRVAAGALHAHASPSAPAAQHSSLDGGGSSTAMAMSGGSDGWTNFTPSADTRTVYVSSASGDDHNDGLSPASAKSTLAAGIALLRHGYPDWLLLERGAVWHESLGQWKKSGRSASEPMLVATYGDTDARPRLETGSGSGIFTNPGAGSPATIDDLAIVGVHFHADGYTGGGNCIGGQFLQPASHVLIEDCKFEGYSGNLVFQGYGGHHTDFRLRRSVIVDAYAIHSIGGHSQGLYAYAVDGLLLEENVFDHNGWNENVAGAGADIFSHNIYIDNGNTGVVVRGNVIANASSHGMQLRPGGTVVNNLFVRNSIALAVGGGNNPEPNGVTTDVRGNVIVDGKNIDDSEPRGWAMWFANIASGHVAQNLIANNTLGTQPSVMTLDGEHQGDSHDSIGVHNLTIDHNIVFNWGGSVFVKGNPSQISEIQILNNDVQDATWSEPVIEHSNAGTTHNVQSAGNHIFCQLTPGTWWTAIATTPHTIGYWFSQVSDGTSAAMQMAYSDPTRSPASYNATVGGAATLADFLSAEREQSATNWRPEMLAAVVARYVRQGF
jgi:hypothetical protein